MRLRMDVQAGARALAANLAGRASAGQRAGQQMVRRRALGHYRRVYVVTPKRSEFMANSLRLEFTPQDLGYRIGWVAEDFESEGKYPYYRVVLFGSSRQTGNDFFSPIAEDEEAAFRAENREIVREHVTRRGRGRSRR